MQPRPSAYEPIRHDHEDGGDVRMIVGSERIPDIVHQSTDHIFFVAASMVRGLQNLKMPGNLRSMLLPNLDELRNFPALGPEGLNNCDINGRATSIECYLDLNLNDYSPTQIIWSNYKKDVEAWHGALEHKESYMRQFMEQSAKGLTTGT